MKAIAFGGPFMHGHKLVIYTTHATWDNNPIIGGFPSSFTNGEVSIRYDSIGDTMQKGREGKAMHVVHLTLPLGVQVQVNRWMVASEGNYINARISMSPQPGQDGHCGNFNGNPADDERAQVRARVGKTGVAVADLIFSEPKMPIIQGNRPDLNDCPQDKLDDAHTDCKNREKKFIPSMACLIDECFAGKGFVAHT